jgi:hypothetical protein
MNIVKLRDILMPDDCSFSKFFNESLKGKYAYWVQMRYIFPLESMDYPTYIKYEQYDEIDFLKANILPHIDLYSEECCMYDFTQTYVDCDITQFVNTSKLNEYLILNEYSTDSDLDISKIRNFRSWLAKEILLLCTAPDNTYIHELTENQVHMLNYYKNDMYNDVVKQLSVFGIENAFTINESTGCNCCTSNISILNPLAVNSGCNALNIYIKNIHNLMVHTFEDVNFWLKFDKDFIVMFKKYIDNIIKAKLSITELNNHNNIYKICECNSYNNTNELLLINLSEALQYIIDEETAGHMNFIHDALYNWAEKLYDKMSWIIK